MCDFKNSCKLWETKRNPPHGEIQEEKNSQQPGADQHQHKSHPLAQGTDKRKEKSHDGFMLVLKIFIFS